MPTLHLIRHGESANNVIYNHLVAEFGGGEAVAAVPELRRCVEEEEVKRRSPDPGLSERGLMQAQRASEASQRGRCDSLRFGAPCGPMTVVCSPMRRACLTAEPIVQALKRADAPELKVLCHARYFEKGGCHDQGAALPGRTYSEICNDHPLLQFDGSVGFPSAHGGWYSAATARERAEEWNERVDEMYVWITSMLADMPESGRLLLVGHGAFMGVLTARLMGLPVGSGAALLVCANTGVHTLRFVRDRAGFLVLALNDTRHLDHDPDLISGNDPAEDGWVSALDPPTWTLCQYCAARGLYMSPALRAQTLALRRICLWSMEAGVSAVDYEAADARAEAILCLLDGSGNVAGHVQYDPHTKRLRQLLVLPQFRRLGIGRALVRAVVEAHGAASGAMTQSGTHKRQRAEDDGDDARPKSFAPALSVHAWQRSEGFYERCGFVRKGEEYESNGVMCVRMEYHSLTAVGSTACDLDG